MNESGTPLRRKAFAFVVDRGDDGNPRLLAFQFADRPDLPLRLPGGNLEEGEAPEAGMRRELREEAGTGVCTVRRLIGVRHYWKEFIGAFVERHDFLVDAPELPRSDFSCTVQSNDEDSGDLLNYRWLTVEELPLLDEEFRRDITSESLPELFEAVVPGVPRT